MSATDFLIIIDDPILLEWMQLIFFFFPDFLFDRSCRTKKKSSYSCPHAKKEENNTETYI